MELQSEIALESISSEFALNFLLLCIRWEKIGKTKQIYDWYNRK